MCEVCAFLCNVNFFEGPFLVSLWDATGFFERLTVGFGHSQGGCNRPSR